MSYSEEYAVSPERAARFFDEALEAALRPGAGRELLSPPLALAVLEKASLSLLKADGWGCAWMALSAGLPPEPLPGGSWRLRGARAAAARDPGFGAEIPFQRRAGKLSTGPFMKPWAASLPHLADFAAGERVEFLRLMPDEARAAAERAWREEADVVRRRLAAVEEALRRD